jgi:hypothetical protein
MSLTERFDDPTAANNTTGWTDQFTPLKNGGFKLYRCDFCKQLYPPEACPFNDKEHGANKPYNHPSRFRGCPTCKHLHSVQVFNPETAPHRIQQERIDLWQQVYDSVNFETAPCMDCPGRAKCLSIGV